MLRAIVKGRQSVIEISKDNMVGTRERNAEGLDLISPPIDRPRALRRIEVTVGDSDSGLSSRIIDESRGDSVGDDYRVFDSTMA